jgi:epsin
LCKQKVRQKAKDITSLLLDEQRLKEERRSRHQMQDRMAGIGDYMNDVMWGGKPNGSGGEDHVTYKQPGYVDEDKDLKRAIEESKRMAEQDSRNRGNTER